MPKPKLIGPPAIFAVVPSDYLSSSYACISLAAQGLWFRMQLAMLYTERYGYLQFKGERMPDWVVARRVETTTNEYMDLLAELDRYGLVPREARTCVIYSPDLLAAADLRADGRARTRRSRLKAHDGPETQGMGYVYYAASSGRLKIGFSKNPWSSIGSVKATFPDARLFALEKGSRQTAQDRRQYFSDYNLGGDWFRFEGRLRDFAERIDHDSQISIKGTSDYV